MLLSFSFGDCFTFLGLIAMVSPPRFVSLSPFVFDCTVVHILVDAIHFIHSTQRASHGLGLSPPWVRVSQAYPGESVFVTIDSIHWGPIPSG